MNRNREIRQIKLIGPAHQKASHLQPTENKTLFLAIKNIKKAPGATFTQGPLWRLVVNLIENPPLNAVISPVFVKLYKNIYLTEN